MSGTLGKILFFALLATFPLGLLVRLRLATNIYITPQDILVFLLFVLTVTKFFRKSRPIFSDKFIFFQKSRVVTFPQSLNIRVLICQF